MMGVCVWGGGGDGWERCVKGDDGCGVGRGV